VIPDSFVDELEKIARKEWTAHGIHRRLGAFGVPRKEWDNNEEFMAWTQRLVGKKHLDDMKSDELKSVAIGIARRYKPKKPGPKKVEKFAKRPELPVTPADRGVIQKKLRAMGKSPTAVTLKRVDSGYAVTTHRARSSFYPTPEAIPISKIRFIESTG